MRLVGLFALFALWGCMSAARRQELMEVVSTPVICHGKEECELAWGKAVSWVSETCGFLISTQTEYVIETVLSQNPHEARPYCRVNRVPIDATDSRLTIVAGCRNMFGCNPDVLEIQASFHRTMKSFLSSLPAEPDE